MWVYRHTETDPEGVHLFTVGFYAPDGTWHTDMDGTREECAQRVNYLNGRQPDEKLIDIIADKVEERGNARLKAHMERSEEIFMNLYWNPTQKGTDAPQEAKQDSYWSETCACGHSRGIHTDEGHGVCHMTGCDCGLFVNHPSCTT